MLFAEGERSGIGCPAPFGDGDSTDPGKISPQRRQLYVDLS